MSRAKLSRNSLYWFSFLQVLSISFLPSIARATVYFVSNNGSNTNPGTDAAPFSTIKHGVSRLTAGDTLYVKAGTYSESILSWETPIPNGISWNKPVTIAANPGDTVTILPPSGDAFFWIKDGQAKYLIIDGFVIDGRYEAWHGVKLQSSDAQQNTRYVRIQNTEIKNTKEAALLLTTCKDCSSPGADPYDTFHEIINLNVHHAGDPINPQGGNVNQGKYGVYSETSRNLIERTEFHHNTGYGLHIYSAGKNASNHNIIRYNHVHHNNTLYNNGCGLISSSGVGDTVYGNIVHDNAHGICVSYRSTDALVYNNVVYNNHFDGITITDSTNRMTRVFNNTVYGNGHRGIHVHDDAKDAVIRNNISTANHVAQITFDASVQTTVTESNNFTGDPSFVDASSFNFALLKQSEAIDAGVILTEVPDDFEGNLRPQGDSYDIGAFEFVAADVTPPAGRGTEVDSTFSGYSIAVIDDG
ncbi:MAG: right-handed parallel beta-helix repeat-containing protein, partial [Myxococcota bacterium]